MDGNNLRRQQADVGVITIEEEGCITLPHRSTQTTVTATSFRCLWQPTGRLKRHLFEGFQLPLRCVIGHDGLRRIYPYASFEGFIELASAGGLAILCQHQKLTKRQRHSYRLMRFLFQKARRMSEFFRNSFKYSRDLYIVKSARSDPSERDILPDTVGLDARQQGHH